MKIPPIHTNNLKARLILNAKFCSALVQDLQSQKQLSTLVVKRKLLHLKAFGFKRVEIARLATMCLSYSTFDSKLP